MSFGEHTTCPLQSRVCPEHLSTPLWRKATAVQGWRALVADGLVEVDPQRREPVPQVHLVAVAVDPRATRSPCSPLTHTADRCSLDP